MTMLEIGICKKVCKIVGKVLDPFGYLIQHAWRKMANVFPNNSVNSRRFLEMEASWRSWLAAVYSRLHFLSSEREGKVCAFKDLPSVGEDSAQS